jgi:hypothetical protein
LAKKPLFWYIFAPERIFREWWGYCRMCWELGLLSQNTPIWVRILPNLDKNPKMGKNRPKKGTFALET